MKKKIIFCGGGTGGHIFPAVSLCNFFSKKNYETIIVTDKRGMNYFKKDFLSYKIMHFFPNKSGILNKIFFYLNLLKVFINSFFYLIKIKPNIVFGLGGYVAFPICLAAKLLKIKIVLYEPNIVIGRVNNFFSSSCTKLFTNSTTVINLPIKQSIKCIKIGNILREEILKYNLEKKDYSNPKKTIIILGGSQGAKVFGEVVPEVILELIKNYRIQIIQQSIPEQVEKIREIYNNYKIENHVFSFYQNIYDLISKADFAITRCGSSTLSELEFLGIPFIAIPYPFAKDNHQYQNAVYYEKRGCCWVLDQKNFTHSRLKQLLTNILENNADLSKKRKNMLKNDTKNSLIKIEKEIKKLI